MIKSNNKEEIKKASSKVEQPAKRSEKPQWSGKATQNPSVSDNICNYS